MPKKTAKPSPTLIVKNHSLTAAAIRGSYKPYNCRVSKDAILLTQLYGDYVIEAISNNADKVRSEDVKQPKTINEAHVLQGLRITPSLLSNQPDTVTMFKSSKKKKKKSAKSVD